MKQTFGGKQGTLVLLNPAGRGVSVCLCVYMLGAVFGKNKGVQSHTSNKSVYFVIQRGFLPVECSSTRHTSFQSRWVFMAHKCYIDFGMLSHVLL